MKKTKIEWCDATVNTVFGCTYTCPYCYARKLNNRFKWINEWSKPEFFKDRLEKLNTKKSYNIFMNSMSDIADWKSEWVKQVFSAINHNSQNNYLFLTKRPLISGQNIDLDYLVKRNIWFGTTYTGENGKALNELLEYREDCNLFLSIEPLLEYPAMLCNQVPKNIDRIKWIIIGAETGNRKEKVVPKEEWVNKIVGIAKQYNIPVFMKNSLISIVGEYNMLRQFPSGLNKL